MEPSHKLIAAFYFESRFERLKLLGVGGMARVYKAFDPTLGRTVALKFIRGDHPEFAERLLMEARSQARIEHEHVCKVYETGSANGKPFIAMQFIKGKTLTNFIRPWLDTSDMPRELKGERIWYRSPR